VLFPRCLWGRPPGVGAGPRGARRFPRWPMRAGMCACAARSAALWTPFLGDPSRRDWGPLRFPWSFVWWGLSLLFWGGRSGGLGENLKPGRLGVPGGSGFPPSAFPDWSPLLNVYSCSRAVVFLTSTTLLFEGLRSGKRRRHGASTLVQAAGGTEPEPQGTVPAPRALCCAVVVRRVYGSCVGQQIRCNPGNPRFQSRLCRYDSDDGLFH